MSARRMATTRAMTTTTGRSGSRWYMSRTTMARAPPARFWNASTPAEAFPTCDEFPYCEENCEKAMPVVIQLASVQPMKVMPNGNTRTTPSTTARFRRSFRSAARPRRAEMAMTMTIAAPAAAAASYRVR